MLQAVYHLSQIHPLQYRSAIIALLLVVCCGWYRLGAMRQVVIVLSTPTPTRTPITFQKSDRSQMFRFWHLAIMGKYESNDDQVALTIAVQVT